MTSIKADIPSRRPGLRRLAVDEQSRARRLKRGRRFWLAPLALLPLVLGLVAWNASRGAPAAYDTVTLERGDIVRSVSASGMVNPVETVQIGSYVSGRIQGLSCDYNTQVTQGQVCAKIDPRAYQATVEQAVAAQATARAQLAKDRASFDFLKLVYERRVALARRGVLSQEAIDESLSTYRQAEAQLALDAAAISQREAELAAAHVNLDLTDIISPVDGTVVSRNVTIGQTVAASFQTPTLFLIARDLTQMQVDINVSEADIGQIRSGEKAAFTVEAFPDRRFSGVVDEIRQAPISVQNVISYDVVVKVANPELLLKPGMTATAHIVTAEHDDVTRLPEEALRFTPDSIAGAPAEGTGGHGAVWVLRSGRLQRVAVTLGLADDSHVEITGGALAPGDRVVTAVHTAAATGSS